MSTLLPVILAAVVSFLAVSYLSGGLNQTAMIATADKISCALATGAHKATTTMLQQPAKINTEGTLLWRRLPPESFFVIRRALFVALTVAPRFASLLEFTRSST
jgi:hypothetical protein